MRDLDEIRLPLDVGPVDGGPTDRGVTFEDVPRPDVAVPDTGVSDDDTGVSDDDTGVSDDDAGESPPDAGPEDTGPADTGPAGCTYPPLMIDGPFSPGPPPASAHLLLTDTSSNTIFRVSLTGAVLQQWPSPVARVYGVSHDRRDPTGFWIAGFPRIGEAGANRPFRRLDFTGAVTADLAYSQFSTDGFRGTDFALGPTPADDVLVFSMNNRNNIDTISGALTTDGTRWFEGGLLSTNGWNGVHVERYACNTPDSLVYWTTRAGALVLREWPIDGESRTHVLPTTDPRGVTRTPYGDFYVVDGAQRRVLHLDASGNLLGSFATPGPNPADVSYGE